jgi:hypothetical protein
MTGTVLCPSYVNALTDSPPSICSDDQRQHFVVILAGTMHAISKTSDCCLFIVNSETLDLQSEDHPMISSLLEMAATLAVQFHMTSLHMTNAHELQSCIDCFRDLKKDSPHPKLLIAGSKLETTITFVALEALAYGFEVYLLMDFIEQPDKEFSQFHVQRLQQAGTVSTTLIQLLGEWFITSESAELTDRIAEISAKLHKSRLHRS